MKKILGLVLVLAGLGLADAKEFMKDHKGKSMFRFREVTMEIIRQSD